MVLSYRKLGLLVLFLVDYRRGFVFVWIIEFFKEWGSWSRSGVCIFGGFI